MVLVIKAGSTISQGETKLIALEVSAFEAARVPTEVRLKVDARAARAGLVRELGHVVKDFPGDARVVVALETSEGPRTLELGPDYRVRPGRLLRRGKPCSARLRSRNTQSVSGLAS